MFFCFIYFFVNVFQVKPLNELKFCFVVVVEQSVVEICMRCCTLDRKALCIAQEVYCMIYKVTKSKSILQNCNKYNIDVSSGDWKLSTKKIINCILFQQQ